jgi:F-type H+-transporting ATPase subunit b
MDEPENNSDIEQYRHSSVVQAIAHATGLKTETAAQIFEDLNSGVLLFAIGFALWKFLPKIFRKRSEDLQKDLVSARLASEDANRRLAEVEARLLRLDSEIETFRHQVEQEAVEDEKRIHATLESERERVVASAEQEIAAAQSAAQRELKKFAAELAIDHAMRRIQLSSDTDRALVREFGKSLNKNSGGEA